MVSAPISTPQQHRLNHWFHQNFITHSCPQTRHHRPSSVHLSTCRTSRETATKVVFGVFNYLFGWLFGWWFACCSAGPVPSRRFLTSTELSSQTKQRDSATNCSLLNSKSSVFVFHNSTSCSSFYCFLFFIVLGVSVFPHPSHRRRSNMSVLSLSPFKLHDKYPSLQTNPRPSSIHLSTCRHSRETAAKVLSFWSA